MALTKRHLQVFLGEPEDGEQAPLPSPPEVLYVEPNGDGTRKMCQNCILWLASDQQCLVHSPDLDAAPEGVCGYHVFGRPSPAAASGAIFGGLAPEQTGYIETAEGTSCDRCRWYTSTGPEQGTCAAVQDPDTKLQAAVAALGCCARWSAQNAE